MPRLATPRITLYAETRGAGDKLLWIGGTGSDLREPPFMLDTPLTRAFEVAVYDQRGLGRSDKPTAPATMADYADDAAALLDALGWARAHVAGYSFGAMVAQHVAIGHGARIDRLVLAATSPGGEGGAPSERQIALLSRRPRLPRRAPRIPRGRHPLLPGRRCQSAGGRRCVAQRVRRSCFRFLPPAPSRARGRTRAIRWRASDGFKPS
jgi:pimeloyl-ACP methyl ester carboxylesterase